MKHLWKLLQLVRMLPKTYDVMKSSLYRNRQKRFPTIPQSREDVSFQGEWENSLSGERFLLCDHADTDKIIKFATNENLKLLSEANTSYIDRIFGIYPRIFYQPFTINAFICGKQFPLLYSLLPAKTRVVYNRMFTLLKESLQHLGLQIINPLI